MLHLTQERRKKIGRLVHAIKTNPVAREIFDTSAVVLLWDALTAVEREVERLTAVRDEATRWAITMESGKERIVAENDELKADLAAARAALVNVRTDIERGCFHGVSDNVTEHLQRALNRIASALSRRGTL